MSKPELLFRSNMNEYINKIKEKNPNAKFYSHSRIENFGQCKNQYRLTYIDKKPQKDGVYGILGTAAHSGLEDLYEGKTEVLKKDIFDREFMRCELFGINFPVSKYDIKGGYKKDIDTFYNTYKKREKGEFISELGFVLKIDEDHYIMGYIDLLILYKDGTCEIVDFKTSTDFDKKKVIKAGRQLILYKEAIEQLYGLKVINVCWEMLKYVDVKVANNKIKKALRGREWVSKITPQVKTVMKNKGYDDFLIDMYLAQAVDNNSISGLPENIKSEIDINTYIRDYEVTESNTEEFWGHVKRSINEIETIDPNNKELWEITFDSFFCTNLCGFFGRFCTPND